MAEKREEYRNGDTYVTSEEEAGCSRIEVHGEAFHDFIAPFKPLLMDHIDRYPEVVVNLDGTTFLDSTMLSFLIHGVRRARDQNKQFILEEPADPNIRAVFYISGLNRVFWPEKN